MITYEYNIYRSKNTEYINSMLKECCFVWNRSLAIQRRYYKMFGKYVSYNRMSSHFTKRYKNILLHSQTRQEILQRLDSSYQRFFKRLSKRPPKFKRNECFSSFVFRQGGFTLNGNVFTINKIKKRFKFSYSRPYVGKVKQVRVKRCNSNRYSIYITADNSFVNSYGKTHNGASVGIDFGLKTYMTLSDGTTFESPRFFKQYESKVRLANKRLSKSKKGSNNHKRRRFELNQVYRKIKNKRNDYQWKLAHNLCKSYDYIFIETLDIDAMKKLWGKKISDLSHSEFIEKLIFTASKYNVKVHKIDKWYPSSKTCKCGYVYKSLSLKERLWKCPECGSINERDLNASKNILRRGIYELESKRKTS